MINMQFWSYRLVLVTSLFCYCSRVQAVVFTTTTHIHQDPGLVYDYVIIGGGPAGLTLANRLTEDPAVSVAVVEAGSFYEDVNGNKSTVPGYDFHYDGKSPNETIPFVDWRFLTTPQAVSIPNTRLCV